MYRNFKIVLVLFALTFAFACDDDSDADALLLSLDDDNLSAPFLDANTAHEAIVRFSSSLTASHTDKSIASVQAFLSTVPNSLTVNVYGAGTSSNPGTLLASKTVNTSSLRSNNTWYTFDLDDLVAITGDDIWVGVSVQHNERVGIIGCDPGPAVTDGDWYKIGSGNYQTFRNYTGNGVDINWNIRARMQVN